MNERSNNFARASTRSRGLLLGRVGGARVPGDLSTANRRAPVIIRNVSPGFLGQLACAV